MKQGKDPVIVIEKSDGLGAFLWGLALGAGVALLFAPQTGDDTRRMLRQRGRRLWAAAEEKAAELQDLIADNFDEPDGDDEAEEGGGDRRPGGRGAPLSARDELERRLSQTREARTRSRRPAPEAEPET